MTRLTTDWCENEARYAEEDREPLRAASLRLAALALRYAEKRKRAGILLVSGSEAWGEAAVQLDDALQSLLRACEEASR